MNPIPDNHIPQVHITDHREPSLEERLRTPTTQGIYSHTGIELATEAAEHIEVLKADNEYLREENLRLAKQVYEDDGK